MKEGPDIALIASLIGDPARANILTALLSGQALTPSELAQECGLTLQTVSSHLSKLAGGQLIEQRKQGRHRYFTLAGEDIAEVLETLMGMAARRGHLRIRTGPGDPHLRDGRICYDHLAGTKGVQMFDSLVRQGLLSEDGETVELTQAGENFAAGFGVELAPLMTQKRPLCRSCLDWSERRTHLAGSLGAAFLNTMMEKGWAERREGTRIISFTTKGQKGFDAAFPNA